MASSLSLILEITLLMQQGGTHFFVYAGVVVFCDYKVFRVRGCVSEYISKVGPQFSPSKLKAL